MTRIKILSQYAVVTVHTVLI